MKITKESFPRIATTVWVIGLVLTGFDLSIPPARVPIFVGLACIASVPLVFGSRWYRVFGIVGVAVSLFLAYGEYESGKLQKARMERFRQKIAEQHSATNSQPFGTTKP
jgi:membrane protein implicated in regulation of membrane protease activity